MNITVIGGGNMGSILSVKFSQKNNVTLFLNSPYEKPSEYSKNLKVFCEDTGAYVEGKIANITDDLETAVKDASWIVITYPAFLFKKLATDLIPLLKAGQHLLFVPGSGGAEIVFKDALSRGCTISGLQRVHSVARIMEKGKEVRESGIRSSLCLASIPGDFNSEACAVVQDLYSLPVAELDNYLNVTLVNSNPILHTSRLYSIFKDYPACKGYSKLPLFYEEWDIDSSKLLVAMDKELFEMIDELKRSGIEVNHIESLLEHYESTNELEMTQKINSINSFKGLKTSSVTNKEGLLEPDLSSRYFTADFPYGLDILLSFASVLKIDAPNMIKVSNWYHDITGIDEKFELTDHNINSISDIKDLYLG